MSRDASADLDSVLSNDEFLTTEVDLLRTPHVLCTPVIWPDLKYKDVRYSLLDRRTEYSVTTGEWHIARQPSAGVADVRFTCWLKGPEKRRSSPFTQRKSAGNHEWVIALTVRESPILLHILESFTRVPCSRNMVPKEWPFWTHWIPHRLVNLRLEFCPLDGVITYLVITWLTSRMNEYRVPLVPLVLITILEGLVLCSKSLASFTKSHNQW